MTKPRKCCENPNRHMGLVTGPIVGVQTVNWHCANCGAHWTEQVGESVEKGGVTRLLPFPEKMPPGTPGRCPCGGVILADTEE
jgi:hypothetical protein